MSRSLPPEIRVSSTGQATMISLPRPESGPPRALGCVLVFFGICFSGFAVFWMAGASGLFERNPPHAPALFQWGRLIFAAFGLIPFFAGMGPVLFGLFMLSGAGPEIRIDHGHLAIIRRLLFFHRSRKCRLETITGFRVAPPPKKKTPATPWDAAGLTLFADSRIQQPFEIVSGYSTESLTVLGEFLVQELKTRNFQEILKSAGTTTSHAVIVEDAAPDASPERKKLVPQPPKSKIISVPGDDRLTLIIPRTGFTGAALGLLVFSILWLGFCSLFVFLSVRQAVQQPRDEHISLLVLVPFVAVGVAMFLLSLQLALRKAVIVATRESLVFTQTGPLHNRELQWPVGTLSDIRPGDSGTEVNDKPLRELQVHTTDGKHRGLFVGRDEPELDWLASVLSEFYALGTDS